MRLFATVLVVMLFLPTTGDKKQSQPTEQNTKAQDAASPTPVTVNVVQNPPPAPPQQNCSESQAHNWHEAFWPPIWSNWALIAVAAFAASAAFATLGEIKKQSAATEKAANAASDNALAVINAERAWIVVDLELKPGTGTVHTNGPTKAQTISVSVLLNCRNEGKTMAWIIEKWADATAFTVVRENPDFGDKDKIFQHAIQSLPAGKKEDFGYPLYFSVPNKLDSRGPILIYGYIKYRTIFEKREGETRFAYILTPMNNLDTLPPEYPQYNAST